MIYSHSVGADTPEATVDVLTSAGEAAEVIKLLFGLITLFTSCKTFYAVLAPTVSAVYGEEMVWHLVKPISVSLYTVCVPCKTVQMFILKCLTRYKPLHPVSAVYFWIITTRFRFVVVSDPMQTQTCVQLVHAQCLFIWWSPAVQRCH